MTVGIRAPVKKSRSRGAKTLPALDCLRHSGIAKSPLTGVWMPLPSTYGVHNVTRTGILTDSIYWCQRRDLLDPVAPQVPCCARLAVRRCLFFHMKRPKVLSDMLFGRPPVGQYKYLREADGCRARIGW
jgi:hypothetical protein